MLKLFIVGAHDVGVPTSIAVPGALIGRDAMQCEVVIPEANVSSRHALLSSQDGLSWYVQDAGSTNGTYLDGARVGQSPILMPPRGELRFAGFRAEFEVVPDASDAGSPFLEVEGELSEMTQVVRLQDWASSRLGRKTERLGAGEPTGKEHLGGKRPGTDEYPIFESGFGPPLAFTEAERPPGPPLAFTEAERPPGPGAGQGEELPSSGDGILEGGFNEEALDFFRGLTSDTDGGSSLPSGGRRTPAPVKPADPAVKAGGRGKAAPVKSTDPLPPGQEPAASRALQADLDRLRTENSGLTARTMALEREIQRLEEALERATQELRASREQAASLKQQLEAQSRADRPPAGAAGAGSSAGIAVRSVIDQSLAYLQRFAAALDVLEASAGGPEAGESLLEVSLRLGDLRMLLEDARRLT